MLCDWLELDWIRSLAAKEAQEESVL